MKGTGTAEVKYHWKRPGGRDGFGGKDGSTIGVPAPKIVPAGDEAVLVEFGRVVSRELNRRVHGLAYMLTRGRRPWLREVVPAYASLLVYYDPDRVTYQALLEELAECAAQAAADAARLPPPRRVEIPVYYGGENGPDLPWVAERVGMSVDQVIAAHSAPTYVVYMLGFMPGFCYLGDLPEALAVERLPTPRLSLPAGAVAIGGRQTGVYSLDNSPGGWRWIGRTPRTMWDPRREQPFLVRAGDEVRFVPA